MADLGGVGGTRRTAARLPRPHGRPHTPRLFEASRFWISLLTGLLLLLAYGRNARAEGVPEGAWTMTPLTETVTVQQWSAVCGTAPSSRTLHPGGTVSVMSDAGEIVIATAAAGGVGFPIGSDPSPPALAAPARPLRTDQCIDPMPTLVRDAHSADGKTWRTRCSTPSGDARHAVVNTAFFLTGDSLLSIAETGRYELHIKGNHCVADVLRKASLRPAINVAATPTAADSAIARDAPRKSDATSPSGAAAAAPVAGSACATPGNPARVEVRPSRKLLRVGDVYRFRAIVLDAAGCPTGSPVGWAIVASGAPPGALGLSLAIDGTGKLSVPTGAASDFKFDVVATAAGRSARAAVAVTSDQNYESLLAHSGLDANGERAEPAVALMATTSLGGSGASAEDGARRRRVLFLAVVGVLAMGLAGVALMGALRARKARAAERAARARHAERMRDHERIKRERHEQHAAQMRAHLESVAVARQGMADTAAVPDAGPRAAAGAHQCPFCGREFDGQTSHCPFDAHALVATASALAPVPTAGGTCPTCRRDYDVGIRLCPHDGTTIVPQTTVGPVVPVPRGKICPTCGGRFEGNAAFCGRDGTMLVLLN